MILATVSISMLTGENGIINNAQKAKSQTAHSGIYEKMKLEVANYSIDKNLNQTDKTLTDYLIEKGILTEIEEGKWQIDVEELMDSKQSYGKGTATETEKKDVYMLEENMETGYVLNKKVASLLGILVGIGNPIPSLPSWPTEPFSTEAVTKSTTYIVKYYGETGDEVELGDLVDGFDVSKGDYGWQIENGEVVFKTKPGDAETGNRTYTEEDYNNGDCRFTSDGSKFRIFADEYVYLYNSSGELISSEPWSK